MISATPKKLCKEETTMTIELLSYCSITDTGTKATLTSEGELTIHDPLGRVGYAHFAAGVPAGPATLAQTKTLAELWCTPGVDHLLLGGPVCAWAFAGLTHGDVCGLSGSPRPIAVC